MGSDANKMNDATSYQPSEPAPCATGCGFFGSAATNNLCSKCFRDNRIKEEQAASAIAAVDKLVNDVVTTFPHKTPPSASSSGSETLPPPAAAAQPPEGKEKIRNRCLTCNKKVGVMGFVCKCGDTFCGSHRYPEKHDCEFDFKKTGKDAIAKANPIIKADKVDRI